MRIQALGDAAILLRDLDCPAHLLAAAIEEAQLPGVLEAVASYESVGVYFDPSLFDERQLTTIQVNRSTGQGHLHEIPVCYDLGEDLLEISRHLGLKPVEVIELHSKPTYQCFAVGFCPGFPYLGYLPTELSGVSRRPAPRVRVEPGSVAITGRQTGIYPLQRPGGWSIIGRTPLCLVDVEGAYFPIRAGDSVRFRPISESEYLSRRGERL